MLVDKAWAVVMLDVRVRDSPIGIQTIGQGENVQIISSHLGPGLVTKCVWLNGVGAYIPDN